MRNLTDEFGFISLALSVGTTDFFLQKIVALPTSSSNNMELNASNQPNVTQMALKIQTLDANADELS